MIWTAEFTKNNSKQSALNLRHYQTQEHWAAILSWERDRDYEPWNCSNFREFYNFPKHYQDHTGSWEASSQPLTPYMGTGREKKGEL